MKESARGNWDPREGQNPFQPNPSGVGDCTTTLRRLLIGAVFVIFFVFYLYNVVSELYCADGSET